MLVYDELVKTNEQLTFLWEGKARRVWEEKLQGDLGLRKLGAPLTSVLCDLFLAGFVHGARFERERNTIPSDDSYRKDVGG